MSKGTMSVEEFEAYAERLPSMNDRHYYDRIVLGSFVVVAITAGLWGVVYQTESLHCYWSGSYTRDIDEWAVVHDKFSGDLYSAKTTGCKIEAVRWMKELEQRSRMRANQTLSFVRSFAG